MKRILIIGCGGSGKSTLARALGSKLKLPVIHLDQLWWKEGWQNVSVDDFDAKLSAVLARDRWIIDGNYSRTMEQRLERCDTIVYLDFSRWTCLWGMCQRVLGNYGKVRPDMSAGCPERFDWEFVRWIWNYNRESRARNYMWMAKARHAQSIVLHSRREAQRFLQEAVESPSAQG